MCPHPHRGPDPERHPEFRPVRHPNRPPAYDRVMAAEHGMRLLERERELARIEELANQAIGGRGLALAIEGPPGVGKTRLLAAARDYASRAGMQVLTARATELERSFSFGVVRQLFAPALRTGALTNGVPDATGATAAALRALGLDAAAAEVPPPSLGDSAFSTLYGLYWLTAGITEDTPALLVIDDAHWADDASLDYLAFLLPRLEELPLLVLFAHRTPEAAGGPLATIGADPTVQRLRPAPLSEEAVAEVLGAQLASPPDPAFVSAVSDVSGGNPFLLQELVRTVVDDGLPGSARDAQIVRGLVPEGISRSILLRLARLSAAARELARAAAVVGDGGELRLAAALAGLERNTASDAARSLRDAAILEDEPSLQFVHPLIRSAIYSDLAAPDRAAAHERAADLLADEGASPERVAIHLVAAEMRGNQETAERLHTAARQALSRGAPAEAASYLRRALREPARGALRTQVFRTLLTASVRGGTPALLEGFEVELRRAMTGDPTTLVDAASELATGMAASGLRGGAVSVLERAIEAAEARGDDGRAADFQAQLISYAQLPPAEAAARFAPYADRLPPGSAAERQALALRAWWASLTGQPAAEAARLARRALEEGRIFAEQPASPPQYQAIEVLIRADEFDAAGAAIDQLSEVATARGFLPQLVGTSYVRAYTAFRRGEVREAEADVRQAVEGARAGGFLAMFPMFTALLVDVLVARGEPEAAERQLIGDGLGGELPDNFWFDPPLFSRGALRLAQGRAREAATDLAALVRRMARWKVGGGGGVPAGSYAGRALATLGEREQALSLANDELAWARRWGAPSAVGSALAALGTIEGNERGLELLHEAVATLEASPARLEHARALLDLGVLLRRTGRRSEAREPLRTALELARRGGAMGVAQHAHDELEATGEKLRRLTPTGIEALTSSERRVAEMAATGMTNREIAQALFLTIKTIESHLHAAYDKLGISSRQQIGSALAADR
jgi:DNA-binding CsgD family transcriptional regulator